MLWPVRTILRRRPWSKPCFKDFACLQDGLWTLVEQKFLVAWEQEFGVGLNVLRRFVDELEDLAVYYNAL